jgi:outer membrane protein TolC
MIPPQLALLLAAVALGAPVLSGAPAPQDPIEPVSGVEITEEGQVLELTLDDAVRVALQRDIGLQIQEIGAEIARYDYAGSWGAFDPVLTASGSVIDADFEIDNSLFPGQNEVNETTLGLNTALLYPLTSGGSFNLSFDHSNRDTNEPFAQTQTTTTDTIELSFSQPLLRGAGSDYNTSTQRESELVYQQELETYRQTRQELLQTVTDAYWDLVSAIEQLRVAEESVKISEEQLNQNERRLDAGVGTEVEVLQSKADLATQYEQRLLREIDMRNAEDALKTTLFPGTNVLYWSAVIAPSTPLPEIRTDDVPPWQEAMGIALERRPELRRSRLAIDGAEQRLIRAVSERRAALDLVLTTRSLGFDGSASAAFRSAAKWEFPTHTALLTYSLPIGNRSASNAEHAARASLRSTRLAYDDLESTVVSEVRAAHRQVRYAAAVVEASQTSVELAQRQLKAEQARFREGLSTNFQVLQFQEDLTTASFTRTQARAAFAKARTALAKAEGLLGEIQE